MSFPDFLRGLMNGMNAVERKKTLVTKLTSEEIVRFTLLNSRAKAISKAIDRMKGKLESDRNRMWADLQDKYNLHGEDLTFDDETGELFVLGDPIEKGKKED